MLNSNIGAISLFANKWTLAHLKKMLPTNYSLNYLYKQVLALNNQQWLICYKSNQDYLPVENNRILRHHNIKKWNFSVCPRFFSPSLACFHTCTHTFQIHFSLWNTHILISLDWLELFFCEKTLCGLHTL